MKLGIHVSSYTWPGGPHRLAQDLTNVARAAEHSGFDKLTVMDHMWQVAHNGPPEREMLEAYTTLGYLAARTTRIQLLTWVTAVVYREPGLLAKAVTTLDVLSGGRAWLGIGAASFEEEARGLGLPFPPTGQRFERLEEALQICLQMWSNDDGPFAGRHYRLQRTLNSPQALARPHPPILIGGLGEKKTLRLVAQYAQACNLYVGTDLPRKLNVLRAHCDAVDRDYDEIQKTVSGPLDPGPNGEHVNALIRQMRELAKMGITHYHGSVPNVASVAPLEILGRRVIPVVDEFQTGGAVIDLHSRRLAGYAIAEHMRAEPVCDALYAAARTCGSLAGAIMHTDHAAQYAAKASATACTAARMVQLMGAVGFSADNAAAESFNASLKRETLHGRRASTDEHEARLATFRWLCLYNTVRRHSRLGNRSPIAYETIHATRSATPAAAA